MNGDKWGRNVGRKKNGGWPPCVGVRGKKKMKKKMKRGNGRTQLGMRVGGVSQKRKKKSRNEENRGLGEFGRKKKKKKMKPKKNGGVDRAVTRDNQ